MTDNRPESKAFLRRARLEKRLDPDSLRRLTVLTAGPGFGKTTLLATCFDSRPAVWHTITPADRSLSVLAWNVVRKLRLIVPGISPELVAAVEGARGPDMSADSGRPVAIAAALAEDLDALLQRDVTLVLDDVHELQGETDSEAFLAAICRYVPRRFRIVTASRSPLPFPISRLAIAGEVEELSAGDLAFTRDEVVELLGMTRQPIEQADEIMGLTGGWPAAVVLAIQSGASETPSLHAALAEKTALFDYLAEEALANETADDIGLLRDIALLPWVTPVLLDRLEFDQIEDSLLAPGAPWMTRAPDVPEAMAVSPLVSEFLQDRYPADEEHRSSLLARAAHWYLEDGSYAEALECLRRSGRSEEIVQALTERGDSMIAAGMTRQIVDAIEAIPEGEVTPELLLMDAEVRQLLGDWEGAMERYRILVPDEGEISARLAWRLGFLDHMRGDVAAALATYERGKLDGEDNPSEAALLGWHASAYWLRGERDLAKHLADEALQRARASGDPRAMATAHTVLAMVAALDGDRALNDVHYIKALEHAERGHDVVQTIRIRSNRGSHFLEEGEFDSALAELDIALRLADMTGFELWRAMALGNRGQVYLYRGRLEEALADLVEARSTFRRIGSLLEAYPLATIAEVYAVRGDTAQARALYTEAIGLAEDQADLQALIPAQAGLSRLLAASEPEAAIDIATRATKADFVIGRAQALVAAGWAHFHGGNESRAHQLAEESAEVARSRHDMAGLAEALELQAASGGQEQALGLLNGARAIWDDLGVPIAVGRVDLAIAELIGGKEGAPQALAAAEDLQRYGAKGLALRARAAAEAMASKVTAELAIKTLGGFDVMVDGHPVDPSAWQSRVAREIIWMLIAGRSRPINREILLDRIWPEDDPEKASNRLSVALTTIRKVFDPAKTHDANHFLKTDRDSVALAADRIDIDVEAFLIEAARGRALLRQGKRSEALTILKGAEERYVGEFLEEHPYADWAVALREEARSEYMTVASDLAQAAEEDGDHDLAARRYLRMLERDVYNEPAHISLVRVMELSGRRGTARRLYGNYVARMAELDVEPEPFPVFPAPDVHS